MHRGPIIMELRGRLGNQMFQFAAAYALSRRIDAPLRFSTRHLGRCPLYLDELVPDVFAEATPREFLQAGRFVYDAPGRRLWDFADRRLSHLRGRATGHHRQVDLRDPKRQDELLDLEPPVLISGWLQREELFADQADAIDAAIRLPDLDPEFLATLVHPIVAVSFRRGDFTMIERTLPLSYYEAALTELAEREQPGTILLVGDDPQFCELAKPWAQRFGPVVNALEYSYDPIVNFTMLANADHSVIANSTFSWWGAWIAERRGDPDRPRHVFWPNSWLRVGTPHESLALERWTGVES